MFRFSSAIVLVSIIVLLALTSNCNEENEAILRFGRPRIIHSSQNNSPYSVLEENTIRIHPYGASFKIPRAWLEPTPSPPIEAHSKNIFLSWDDLNEVEGIDREPHGSDSESADVINAVLPFADCVAHVGDRGWGNYFWPDLQSRVYITSLSPEQIRLRLNSSGLRTAHEDFESVSLSSTSFEGWEKHTFDIIDAPEWSDFILGKRIDFYMKQINDRSVVFVFVHTDPFQDETSMLLNSFEWPSG